MLTKQQKTRREKLRKQMVELRQEAMQYERQIEKIDHDENLAKIKWMTGKCFLMGEENKTNNSRIYCRVEKFDGIQPKGTLIRFFKNKIYNIEFNSDCMWTDEIMRGKKIKPSRFNKYLEKARELTYTPTLREKNPYKKSKYTNFIDKLSLVKPLVISILKQDTASRDDDNILCTLVWQKQGAKEFMCFDSFRKKLITAKFSLPESITRCRRALQEKHTELRGDLYAARHAQEEMVRNQLKMEF